jgi:hypothetical protein
MQCIVSVMIMCPHLNLINMITGIQFNEQYKDYKFVKLTTETENHNNFQFKTGLNIDHVKFNPGGGSLSSRWYIFY